MSSNRMDVHIMQSYLCSDEKQESVVFYFGNTQELSGNESHEKTSSLIALLKSTGQMGSTTDVGCAVAPVEAMVLCLLRVQQEMTVCAIREHASLHHL